MKKRKSKIKFLFQFKFFTYQMGKYSKNAYNWCRWGRKGHAMDGYKNSTAYGKDNCVLYELTIPFLDYCTNTRRCINIYTYIHAYRQAFTDLHCSTICRNTDSRNYLNDHFGINLLMEH